MQREACLTDREGDRVIKLGFSDDYAYMECGKWEFYYGYEETVPPNCDGDSDEDYEWAFVIRETDGTEVLRMSTSEISKEIGKRQYERPCEDSPSETLLAGIGLWLSQKDKKEKLIR